VRGDVSGSGEGGTRWNPRLAREQDIPAIAALIPLSVRALQSPHYSEAQMEAALGPVFGVDSQLIRDRSYYVVQHEGHVVGCGGWSRRSSLFGGDLARSAEDAVLDPGRDPARIRAFFVHPDWARRGIGRSLMAACDRAIRDAGFARAAIVSTLAGEPLYAALGYRVSERGEIPLAGGLMLPVVRMERILSGTAEAPQEQRSQAQEQEIGGPHQEVGSVVGVLVKPAHHDDQEVVRQGQDDAQREVCARLPPRHLDAQGDSDERE